MRSLFTFWNIKVVGKHLLLIKLKQSFVYGLIISEIPIGTSAGRKELSHNYFAIVITGKQIVNKLKVSNIHINEQCKTLTHSKKDESVGSIN